MASVRYRKRGDSNLWTYEIRSEGKTVAHNSGFKTQLKDYLEIKKSLKFVRVNTKE